MLAAAGHCQQAQRSPQIGYVYPAGASRGSTTEVVVGGQVLMGVNAVYVSGEGIRAEVVGHKRPLNVGEVNRIRQRLEDARKKLDPAAGDAPLRPRDILNLRALAKEAGITDEQLRALDEFRRMRSDPKRQPNPQIEEQVTLKVVVDAGAQPGMREIRLGAPIGLTNPLRFFVGELPEIVEVEPNETLPDTAIGEKLPVVINGQITPGDVDRFTFRARKGTNLVASVMARQIMPYLADAVPGWFQAVVSLRDKDGREIAYDDDFQFRPDPVLTARIPADGEYTLEVRDSIYRGREDFVYRVTLGEVPFVTGVFPLGVRRGTRVSGEVRGWNLPAKDVTLDGRQAAPLSSLDARFPTPPPEFAVDDLPEAAEREPNDGAAQAQPIRAPVIVNGRIGRPGDADVVRLYGRKGAKIVAEVVARRLGSPLDSVLALADAKGKQLAFSDDCPDRAAGLITHQADSCLTARLPADGTYYLRVSDAQARGGADFGYRLRISAPMPDFELRVTPSSIGVRAGVSVPLTVHAIRRDGFDGPIDLGLIGAPSGFALSGARIPAGADRVRVTLAVAPTRQLAPFPLRIEGIARIGGAEVRRMAQPAEDMMQAFAYRHLVPCRELLVVVQGRAWVPPPMPNSPDRPIRIPLGGTTRVQVNRAAGPMAAQIAMSLDDPPAGVSLVSSDVQADSAALVLSAEVGKAKVGDKGNLIVSVFVRRQAPVANVRRQAQPLFPLGCLPAIPYEVVAGK